LTYPAMTQVTSNAGPLFVRADDVVVVRSVDGGSSITFVDGQSVMSTESAEAVSKRLWTFESRAGQSDGPQSFFNDDHVIAVESISTGCRIRLRGDVRIDMEAPADVVYSSFAHINAQREAIAASNQS
jgi:hypothetical protein